jgi:hypothetical protein
MDDASLLREAATELHAVALLAGDPNGSLVLAV